MQIITGILQRHVTREVAHYWFTKWPDHGVPTATGPFIDFILETRKSVKAGDTFGPAVVHCRLDKNNQLKVIILLVLK